MLSRERTPSDPGRVRGPLLALVGILMSGPAPAAEPPASPLVREGGLLRLGLVTVDPRARTASLPARVNQTNGVIEYALVTDYGKTHESLFVTDAAPRDLQAALLLLNARPGGPESLRGQPGAPSPARSLSVRARWTHGGRTNLVPLHELIALASPASLSVTDHLAAGPWLFNGSTTTAEGFAAHFEGSLVALITDATAIVNNPNPDRDDDDIHVPAPSRVPPLGTAVAIEFEVPRPPRPTETGTVPGTPRIP